MSGQKKYLASAGKHLLAYFVATYSMYLDIGVSGMGNITISATSLFIFIVSGYRHCIWLGI